MKRIIPAIVFIFLVLLVGGILALRNNSTVKNVIETARDSQQNEGGPEDDLHPLSIQALRNGEYPGSDIVIEQTLVPGSNYQRYIASYKSEGLKIYALLTIPNGQRPASGWPVVIFNHGYIPPAEYVTTERYIAYTDAFSSKGYIVFRSDYRGHGNSEGTANSYGSNGYTIDVLNAIASVKRLAQKVPSDLTPARNASQSDAGGLTLSSEERETDAGIVDPDKIGMWGHSMGGHITLRSMVASKDIKAGVVWAGVVASYPDMLSSWRRGTVTPSPFPTTSARGGWRRGFVSEYGTPEENPEFWNSISATSYLSDISGPLQLHHGTADHSVPYEFSEKLAAQLKEEKKAVELYIYPGDEHDIPNNFGTAMERSVTFFDTYLKG